MYAAYGPCAPMFLHLFPHSTHSNSTSTVFMPSSCLAKSRIDANSWSVDVRSGLLGPVILYTTGDRTSWKYHCTMISALLPPAACKLRNASSAAAVSYLVSNNG